MAVTINDVKKMVGKEVTIVFNDGTTDKGILGYTPEFSAKYDYRKPDYFTLNNWDFKASHIKKIWETEPHRYMSHKPEDEPTIERD